MANERDVAVFVGSIRKDALSRRVAKAMVALAPDSLRLEMVEIDDLPMYNHDYEDPPPAPWTALRNRVRAADAVLFVTPEYNRSVPGPLKNAVDVASRPYGHNAWDGKPGAVVSVSIGALGGFGANHHLRQSLVFVNVPTMQQPEAYIGNAGAIFGADGEVVDSTTQGFLQEFLQAFANWIEVHKAAEEHAERSERAA